MRVVCVHGPQTPLPRGSKALPLPSLIVHVGLLEQFFALLPITGCSYFSFSGLRKSPPLVLNWCWIFFNRAGNASHHLIV